MSWIKLYIPFIGTYYLLRDYLKGTPTYDAIWKHSEKYFMIVTIYQVLWIGSIKLFSVWGMSTGVLPIVINV